MTDTRTIEECAEARHALDDIAENAAFDASSGTFELSADLYSHSDVSQGDFTPANGDTKDTTLVIRVIVSAVVDGAIVAEAHVQDTVTLSITRQGMEVSVGGSGSIDVVT